VYVAYALDPLFPEWMEVDVPDSPFDEYLDLVEAARELGIHPQSLRRLIKQGRVPATLFAGKYLIERDKLDIFKSSYDPRPGRKPIRRLL
jgi:excisionase family DNA binding protein